MPSVSDLLYVFAPRNNNTTASSSASASQQRHQSDSSRQRAPSVSSSTYDTWGQRDNQEDSQPSQRRPQARTPVRFVRQGEFDPEYDPNYYNKAHQPPESPRRLRMQQLQSDEYGNDEYENDDINNQYDRNFYTGMWGSVHHPSRDNYQTEFQVSSPTDQDLLLHPPNHITKQALDSSHSTSEVTPPSSAPPASEQPSVTSTLSSSIRPREGEYDYDDKEDEEEKKAQQPSYLPMSTLPHGVPRSPENQVPPPLAASDREVALLDSFRRRPSQRNQDGSLSSSSARRRQRQHQEIQQQVLQQQQQQPQQQRQPQPQQRQLPSQQNDDNNITNSISLDDSHHTMSLHDLCGEATRTDDIAWRNALYLLSVQPKLAKTVTEEEIWTPLHVSCLGVTPPPDFMVRALLYCHKASARAVDAGGRLPLHILAASSADPTILALLVQEYPPSICQRDQAKHGFIPLHLLLRNEEIDVTVEHVRILLGQNLAATTCAPPPPRRVVQRRGEHLDLTLIDLEQIGANGGPRPRKRLPVESEFWEQYPDDVQVCWKRLAQWKKKLIKQGQQQDDEDDVQDSVEVELTPTLEERNPAAMATMTNLLLPLHMMVRRVLHPPSRRNNPTELREHDTKVSAEENDEDEDASFTLEERYHPPSSNVHEVLRVLIAANPRGLITRDAQGRTPLLLALLDKERQADLELMELLLGRSCSNITFQTSLPEWALDLTFPNRNGNRAEEDSAVRFINPAMFATVESLQLPLHVAAEEMAGSVDVISSIHACYPGAIYVQDARGRTPLHIALSNYRRILPPPSVISLLFTDRVARIRDYDGKLPFDLLAEASPTLSMLHSQGRGNCQDEEETDLSIYGKVLAASIRYNPNHRGRISKSITGRIFVRQLGKLPPWLRRQACSAEITQELIMEDLASPGKCAWILFQGVVLGALIATLRLQLNDLSNAWPRQGHLAGLIYTLASGLVVCQVVQLIAIFHCFESRWLLNLGPGINICAAVVTIITTYEVSLPYNKSVQDYQRIANLGSAATAMLWGSVVCYLSSWWYGMAIFMGTAIKTAYWMLWPVLALGVLVVGFAQVLYTHFFPICKHGHAANVPSLCDERDSYKTVYYLLLGRPLEETTSGDLSGGTIVLIVAFSFFAFWLFFSALATLVGIFGRLDYTDIALTWFWEPKLSSLLASPSVLWRTNARHCCRRKLSAQQAWTPKLKLVRKQSFTERYCLAMSNLWEAVVDINLLRRKVKCDADGWYSRSSGRLPLLMGLVSLIIIPIWLALGLVTLGLLWPPQVRRRLFEPRIVKTNKSGNAFGNTSGQVSEARNEIRQLKNMTFEKTSNVQQDIRELKELLLRAMAE